MGSIVRCVLIAEPTNQGGPGEGEARLALAVYVFRLLHLHRTLRERDSFSGMVKQSACVVVGMLFGWSLGPQWLFDLER